MNNIKLLFSILILSVVFEATGQNSKPNKSIYISGYVNSEFASGDLTLEMWDHFYSIQSMFNNSTREMNCRFSNSGYFQFKLDNITQPVYFNLSYKEDRYKSPMGIPILKMYIAEPGDSIVIVNLGKTTEISFYGRGIGKYQCRSELDKKTAYKNSLPYMSSDSFGQLSILERYKKTMSSQAYNIMKADIVGKYSLDIYKKNTDKLKFGNSDIGMRYDSIIKKYDTSRLSGDKLKQYKDMEFRELIDTCAGESIMSLGQGRSMRSIVQDIVLASIEWRIEQEKKKKENEQ